MLAAVSGRLAAVALSFQGMVDGRAKVEARRPRYAAGPTVGQTHVKSRFTAVSYGSGLD
jgi:hypothetical protein